MPEIIIIFILLLFLILFPSIQIVKNDEIIVVERLGKFLKTIEKPGIYMMIPFIDRVVNKVNMKPYFISKKIKKTDSYVKSTIVTYKIEVFDVNKFTYHALDPINELHHFVSEAIYLNKSETEINELLQDYPEQFGFSIQSIIFDNQK